MEAIPWRLEESDSFTIWWWEGKIEDQEIFKVRIQTDSYRASFSWEFFDTSQGYDVSLAEGLERNFRLCEESVRSILGKSYPKNLGFGKYAGKFATTFKIFSGESIDFGPLEATPVIVKVRINNKETQMITERVISGMLHIHNYHLEISPEHGQSLRIPPSHIIEIKSAFGGAVKAEDDDALSRSLRIFKGTVSTGCTGRPGMLPGTVEHSARAGWCPIHEN